MATSFSPIKSTTVSDSNGTRSYSGGQVTSNVPAPSGFGNVTPTDSGGLSAPVLSNGHGGFTGGVYTGGGGSSVPARGMVTPSTYTVTPVSTVINGSGQSVTQTPAFIPPPDDNNSDQKNKWLADIGRSQLAYGVYQNAGRMDLANQAHLNAENDRSQLQALGVDPSQYASNVDLTGYWKGGTPNAYDPSQQGMASSSSVPAPQNYSAPSQQQSQNVPAPTNLYQPLSYDQIKNQVHSQIQQLIQQKQNAAQAAVQQLQLAYNNDTQRFQDDRVLEDWKLSQTMNPYSGGTDYQKAMLSRNRSIADQARSLNLQNQVGKISNDLLDYQNNEQANEEKMIQDKIDSERKFDLQNKQYQLETQKENFNEKHANDTLDFQKQSEKDKLDYEKQHDQTLDNRYQNELQFNKDKWADQKSQWQQEFNFKGSQAQKANQLENDRLQQTKDYQGWLVQKGKTEQQGNQATTGYASEIMGRATSRDDAYKYITEHAQDISKDGANIDKLMNIINEMFPRPKMAAADPQSNPDYYNQYYGNGSPK
jgi:hypothetical protein